MSEQKKNIDCRVCLRYDLETSQKCLSLFEEYNNSLIAEKIKYVANIEIKESDGLPDKICPDCLLQLETAIVFKQKCETSNKILRSIVQQSSKICRVTFRIPVKKEVNVVLEDKSDEHSNSEIETTKLEICKEEIAEIEVTENEFHDKEKPANTGSHIENHVNIISQAKQKEKPKNKEPVNVLPLDVIPKNEEPDYELSDNEEITFDTQENYEVERLESDEEENHKSQDTGNTVGGKPSRAIDLKLICDDCGGSFKSKCKIAVHWKKVHLPTKLICEKCKRMFKSYKAFNRHNKRKTRSCHTASTVRIEGMGKKRVFHCKDCDYSTKRLKDMDAHLVTHSGLRRFQCKDCLKCFTQHSSLQGHRESKHKDYRVVTTCQFCGKVIKGRNKFYKHYLQHKPKSVQCEICKKILKSKSILVNHMKRHNGVKSYTCETCSANFYTMSELCTHRKKVHFKKKIFKCDMCEYTAYTAVLLKKHKSRHTHNNVPCLQCGMFLENAEKFAIHQKKHSDSNLRCPECEKVFFRRDTLRRHFMKKHAEPKKLENIVITLNPIIS